MVSRRVGTARSGSKARSTTISKRGKREHKAVKAAVKTEAKRKRDLELEGQQQCILEKRNGSVYSARAGNEWQAQFYQGESPVDKFAGCGCGFHLLGSPWVASQYPSPKRMKFEISGGTRGLGSGSFRLIGPERYYRRESRYSRTHATFMVPFANVDQIIVLPPLQDANNGDYQIIMVPTAATGLSAIKRHYPQIISFNWPRRPIDEELRGTLAEATISLLTGEEVPAYLKSTVSNNDDIVHAREDETYLSFFKRIVDKQMATFDRYVIDLTQVRDGQQEMIQCPVTLSFRRLDDVDEKGTDISGQLYFTHTGIIFLSTAARLYLPFTSFNKIHVVEAQPPQNGMDAYMHVTEPYHDREPVTHSDDEDPVIAFRDIPVDQRDPIRQYAEKHDIRVKDCSTAPELSPIDSTWKGLFPKPQLVDVEPLDHISKLMKEGH